jgi:hypothetical protein
MATIRVKLLGILNEEIDGNKTLVQKYVACFKANELSQWFQHIREKKGGRTPFKLLDSSIIKTHERVQRGINQAGYVLQEKSKVDDIKDGLLGISKTSNKVYLGAL